MPTGYRFGAFKGVYVPSLLTILGVIMYLRFGWVLGNAGLVKTLVIVTLSTAITALTALSISTLATNMKVGGGGAYFIISRSMGVEAGGAVGMPLFLAKALGISFYISGFSESVAALNPALSPVVVGLATLLALALLAYFSADIALLAQYLILAMVALSLVSFFAGGPPASSEAPLAQTLPARVPFWAVFAVFFPAVTGIEAGLSMSGDLKNPARALPLGTLAAVGTSFLIYLAIPVFLHWTVRDRGLLLSNPMIMKEVAVWGDLVVLGLWGAALSSALGALLGAPRTLQAMAQDGVVPRFLARGFGRGNDPRMATTVSILIGAAGILAGDINVIAPVLTMFFLTTYGLVNLCAALEGMIGSPSWRPEFRVPWSLSLIGAAACLLAALMINPGATFAGTAVIAGVYWFLRRRRMKAYWGDIRYGILMLLARFAVYRLVRREPNIRTWKPNILVLSGSPTSRWYLIALADAISHGKGFLTVAAILKSGEQETERLERLRESIDQYLKKRRVPALVQVSPAENILQGARFLVQTYGFGPLVPNTILLGESEQGRNLADYVELVQTICQSRRNLVIVRESEEPPEWGEPPRIDVWWSHTSQNASFMLALAHLLKTSPEWNGARLVLKSVVDTEGDRAGATEGFSAFLEKGRVEADVEVLVRDGREVFDQIRESSDGASLVFIGLRPPARRETPEEYSRYYEQLMARTEGFPSVAIVLGAEEIQFDRIFASTG